MGLFGLPDITSNETDFYNVAQGLPGFVQGSNAQGLQQAQTGSQNSIAQQQAFVNALGGNGLTGAQANVFGQQQGLANQYGNIASQYGQMAAGQGPNPAQAQLAQNTAQNQQQTAALMAGARGGNSNPGLIARQAGQAGAQAQQQAVGQAATLGAQQQVAGLQGQLGAYQAQGAQQGQLANLATAGAGQAQTGLSQLGNQNLTYQQMLQNALTSQNSQQVQSQVGQAQLAGIGLQNSAGLIGGGLNSIGGLLSGPSFAKGGVVHFDDGGQVGSGAATGAGAGMIASQTPTSIEEQSASNATANGPQSLLGKSSQPQTSSSQPSFSPQGGADALSQGMNSFGRGITGAGAAQNSMKSVKDAISTLGSLASVAAASKGGKVNGKPKVKGDSLKNDTVPAMLSPGEIIIPRSHVGSPEKIASFLNGLLGTQLRAA